MLERIVTIFGISEYVCHRFVTGKYEYYCSKSQALHKNLKNKMVIFLKTTATILIKFRQFMEKTMSINKDLRYLQ
jgi:hypothetical protein